MLREGYIAKWRKYPKDEVKIRVARPSVLAPSKKLLGDFKAAEREGKESGLKKLEARKLAWDKADYERRFRAEILSNPKALAKLKEIKELAKEKDVRLICYERKPPCHRFILMDLINSL